MHRANVVLLSILTASSLLAARSAAAIDWTEVGEAPDLVPGQITGGPGPLELIDGHLDFAGDVDMYCIRITDAPGFLATTTASYDTQLWLFDGNGNGVLFNDDRTDSCSTLQSRLSIGVPAPSTYFIAISSYDNDALNVLGQEIWKDTPFCSERRPDGAGGPLMRWDRRGTATGPYRIKLHGASPCS